jgi:hypothetical protein
VWCAASSNVLTTIDDAFSVARWDLAALCSTTLGNQLYDCTTRVNWELGWLCDAAESGLDDVRGFARSAHRAVLELARLLEPLDSDDRQVRDRLDLARGAVAQLLAALASLR